MNEIGKLVYFRWHSSNSVSTCPDCRARSGMVKRLSEWVNLGLPTAGVTRCGEFCNCYLESVHMVNGAWEKIGDDSYWHMVIERILSNAKGSKKVEKTETIIERVTESSENDVLPEGQHRAILAGGALEQGAQPGSFEILAITAGKGNGWEFGAAVLQNSVPLWDMTECFLDHDLKTRSVKDLAGVLSSPAWDESKRGIRATLRAVGACGGATQDLRSRFHCAPIRPARLGRS